MANKENTIGSVKEGFSEPNFSWTIFGITLLTLLRIRQTFFCFLASEKTFSVIDMKNVANQPP